MALITPIAGGYTVGKGRVYFQRAGEAALIDLGDTDGFGVTAATEVRERYGNNFRTKIKVDSQVTQVTYTASLTLVQQTALARALAFGADLGATHTQSAATDATYSVAAGVVPGAIYQLPHLDVSGLTVTDGAGTPVAYTLGTHYEVEGATGLVRILAVPASADDALAVTYDAAAIVADDGRELHGLGSLPEMAGKLVWRSLTSGADTPEVMAEFWSVKLKAAGEVAKISDDYITVPVAVEIIADTTRAAAYQLGRQVMLAREAG